MLDIGFYERFHELIAGLDENGFVSSRNTLKSKSDIYVMSEAAFKAFELNGGRRYD